VIYWLPAGALGALGTLIMFEYLAFPCPLLTAQVSPFYKALAQEEGDFALLELPIDDFHSRAYLYPQTIHGKRLVNGYVARTPEGARGFIDSHPLTRKLQYQIEIDPALHEVAAEMAVLGANGVRYAVVHKQALPPQPPVDPDVLASWQLLFGPEAYYEDEQVAVYQVPSLPERPPLGVFEGGLAARDVRVRRVQVLDEQSVMVHVTWTALSTPAADYACALSLSPVQEATADAEAEVISPKYPTHQWVPGVVVEEQYAIPIEPSLPQGSYRLLLEMIDPGSGRVMGTLQHHVDIGAVAGPLVPALGNMQVPAGIVYGSEMWLLGYTPRQSGDRLVVEMYWQALRAMGNNYKIFVHLVRPADQAIVSQVDVMPRNWSYPTSRWNRREVFVDLIELDVAGVLPGEYHVVVGVYDPDGDRLPATNREGTSLPGRQATMEQAVVLPLGN
jgi:hypothetical protein